MGFINYRNNSLAVPETINGRNIRNRFNIPNDRTMYTTDLDGNSEVVGNNDTLNTRGRVLDLDDLPRTEKG